MSLITRSHPAAIEDDFGIEAVAHALAQSGDAAGLRMEHIDVVA